MIKLLYFGRLDTEKGLQAIIDMIQYFWQTKQIPFTIDIYGEGSYQQDIKKLAIQYPTHVHYYGFQSLQTIKTKAQQYDYCLMPSLFLETFGLSALNALSRGIPVIWYKKGGCEPFIIDDYDLNQYSWNPSKQLIQMIQKLEQQDSNNAKNKLLSLQIAQQYTKQKRQENIKKLIGNNKKILLISDFINKIGGIETYIHETQQLLEQMWYQAQIIGWEGSKKRRKRILSMIQAYYNYNMNKKIKKSIQNFQPDIIRCHSVLRNIGRLPLQTINQSNGDKRLMIHDVGIIAPFPHTVHHENQLPIKQTRKAFYGSRKSTNPIVIGAMFIKRLLIKRIYRQIQSWKVIVPAPFLQKYFPQSIVLPHYQQE